MFLRPLCPLLRLLTIISFLFGVGLSQPMWYRVVPGDPLPGMIWSHSCQDNCQTCIDGEFCLNCEETFVSVLGKCVPCEGDCLLCEGVNFVPRETPKMCTTCHNVSDYFLNTDLTCEKCHPNCNGCQFVENCTLCEDGFWDRDNNCVNPCESSCSRCWDNGDCRTCSGPNMYIFNNTECFDCLPGCDGCNDDVSCFFCQVGKWGINCSNDCDASCGATGACNKDTGRCLSCPPFHMNDAVSRSCIPCHYSCNETCFAGPPMRCAFCEAGTYRDINNTCTDICDPSCLTCNNQFSCQRCPAGFWSNPPGGGLCTNPCHPSCLDCELNGIVGDCDTCPLGFRRDANNTCTTPCHASCDPSLGCFPFSPTGECLNPCPSGTYKNAVDGLCTETCHPSCETCNGFPQCSTCPLGYHLDVLGTWTCNKTCPVGCATNMSCSSPDYDQCDLCEDGKSGNLCEYDCEPSSNCSACSISSNTTCTRCLLDQWMDIDDTCHDCPQNCYQCFDDTDCGGWCYNGTFDARYLKLDCEYICAAECLFCSSDIECHMCEHGYYLDRFLYRRVWHQECVQCAPECVTCTDGDSCNKCHPGKYRHEGKCLDACPDGTLTKGVECLPCGAEIFMPECVECDDYFQCTKCGRGFFVNESDRSECARCDHMNLVFGGHCVECDDRSTCTKCADFFYLEDGQCKDCMLDCISCTAADTCDECLVGWKLPTCEDWAGYSYYGPRSIHRENTESVIPGGTSYRSLLGNSFLTGGVSPMGNVFDDFGSFRVSHGTGSWEGLPLGDVFLFYNELTKIEDCVMSSELNVSAWSGWVLLDAIPFFVIDVDFQENEWLFSEKDLLLEDYSFNFFGSFSNAFWTRPGVDLYKYSSNIGPWEDPEKKTVTTYYTRDYSTLVKDDIPIYTHTLVTRNLNEDNKRRDDEDGTDRYEHVEQGLADIGHGFTLYLQWSYIPVSQIHAKVLRDLEGKRGYCVEATDSLTDNRLLSFHTDVNSDCSCKNKKYTRLCESCRNQGHYDHNCNCQLGYFDDAESMCSRGPDVCTNELLDPLSIPPCGYCTNHALSGENCTRKSTWSYVGSRSLAQRKELVKMPDVNRYGGNERDPNECIYCLTYVDGAGYSGYIETGTFTYDEPLYYRFGNMQLSRGGVAVPLMWEDNGMTPDCWMKFFDYFNEYQISEALLFDDCVEIRTKYGWTLLGDNNVFFVIDVYLITRSEECVLAIEEESLFFSFQTNFRNEVYEATEEVITDYLPNSFKPVVTYTVDFKDQNPRRQSSVDPTKHFYTATLIGGNLNTDDRDRTFGGGATTTDFIRAKVTDVSGYFSLYFQASDDLTPNAAHTLAMNDVIDKSTFQCNGLYYHNPLTQKYYTENCTCVDPRHAYPNCHWECANPLFSNFPECDECGNPNIVDDDEQCVTCNPIYDSSSSPDCDVCKNSSGLDPNTLCTQCGFEFSGTSCENFHEFFGSKVMDNPLPAVCDDSSLYTDLGFWTGYSLAPNLLMPGWDYDEEENGVTPDHCERCLVWSEDKDSYYFEYGNSDFSGDRVFNKFGYFSVCKKNGKCQSVLSRTDDVIYFDTYDEFFTDERTVFTCLDLTVRYGWGGLGADQHDFVSSGVPTPKLGHVYYPTFMIKVDYLERPGCEIDNFVFTFHGGLGDGYVDPSERPLLLNPAIETELGGMVNDYILKSFSSYIEYVAYQYYLNYAVVAGNMNSRGQVRYIGQQNERFYHPLSNSGHSLTMYMEWSRLRHEDFHDFVLYDIHGKQGCFDFVDDNPYYDIVFNMAHHPTCVCRDGFGEDSSCVKCKARVGPEGTCTQCLDEVENVSPYPECECTGGWTTLLCDVCGDHYINIENVTCEDCAGHWEGDDCEMCPGNWDPDAGCNECLGNYNDVDSDDCGSCIFGWGGENCTTALPNVGGIVGGVIGAIAAIVCCLICIVVLIVVLIVVFCARKQGKVKKDRGVQEVIALEEMNEEPPQLQRPPPQIVEEISDLDRREMAGVSGCDDPEVIDKVRERIRGKDRKDAQQKKDLVPDQTNPQEEIEDEVSDCSSDREIQDDDDSLDSSDSIIF